VPIDDVYLMTMSPYEVDGYRIGSHDELILQQYEQWGVVCVTSAPTFAAPNVTVTVAGSDVTELFTRSVKRRPVLLESGLTRQHVTVRLGYVTSQPKPEMNGKTLRCTAAGQTGFNDVSASAILIVNCTCQRQYNGNSLQKCDVYMPIFTYADGLGFYFRLSVCSFFPHDISKTDAGSQNVTRKCFTMSPENETYLFWIRRSKVKVTSHRNIAGVSLCTFVSAGYQ